MHPECTKQIKRVVVLSEMQIYVNYFYFFFIVMDADAFLIYTRTMADHSDIVSIHCNILHM